mmetsp:Transcript_67677/g.175797  ORF Transcript_67677/g.175797 Transcript_67677/m.175797 type:complete len:104 (+) Transcript_67677:136-447(+)
MEAAGPLGDEVASLHFAAGAGPRHHWATGEAGGREMTPQAGGQHEFVAASLRTAQRASQAPMRGPPRPLRKAAAVVVALAMAEPVATSRPRASLRQASAPARH